MENKTSQWKTTTIISLILAAIPIYFAYMEYIKPDQKGGDTIVINNPIDKPVNNKDSAGLQPKPEIQSDHHVPPEIKGASLQNEPSKLDVIIPSEYVNNTVMKSDIAVVILDANNSPVNSITSGIANLYRNKGYVVTNSLFTLRLFQSKYLRQLENANSQLIEKLELPSLVKYVVIGTYSKTLEPNTGEYVKVVCRANLNVRVISCNSRSQIDGFELAVSNGHDDPQHAEKGAIEKLMVDYSTNHINL